MSIWTPSGEHEIPDSQNPESDLDSTAPTEASPEQQEAMAREFEETRQKIADAPPEQIIATHVIGLYELAFIHLRQDPPNLEAAKLAIDALGSIVDGVGERLGEYGGAMQNALTEIQMAYVKVNSAEDDFEETS